MMIFLVLTESTTPLLAYTAIFGVGLSLSAVYSVTMVYANHTFPGMERTVTSSVTGFAGVGATVFPAVLGYAMDYLLPTQILWMILGFMTTLLVVFLVIYLTLRILRQRYVAKQY